MHQAGGSSSYSHGPSSSIDGLSGQRLPYVDGLAVRLTLDEQGNGHYDWKDGRFETHSLIGHTWQGMWFQKENDREGGFTVEFSPDFSEGEGRWWVSRIGANQTPAQKEGTFHLSRKIALMDHSDPPPAP